MADVQYVTLYPPGGNSAQVQVVEGSQLHLIYAAMGFSATPSAPGQPPRRDPFPQYVDEDELAAALAGAGGGLTPAQIVADPTVRAAFDALGAAGSVITRDPAVSAALMAVAAGTTSDRRIVRPYELRPRRFRAHNIGTGEAIFSYNGTHDFWNFNPDGWQETTVTPGQELLANYTLDALWVYSPTGTTLVLETTIGADL